MSSHNDSFVSSGSSPTEDGRDFRCETHGSLLDMLHIYERLFTFWSRDTGATFETREAGTIASQLGRRIDLTSSAVPSWFCNLYSPPPTPVRPNPDLCPNLYSAWSAEPDQWGVVPRPNLYRCVCDVCLNARASSSSTPTPTSLLRMRRRCKDCGAVDTAKYPKFSESLLGSEQLQKCELYRGLCNRPACERNRRFPNQITDISWSHDKGGYPLGYAGEEVPIHHDLIDWAMDPLPTDGNSVSELCRLMRVVPVNAPPMENVESRKAFTPESYFDEMELVKKRISDRRIQRVIRQWLDAVSKPRLDFGPVWKPCYLSEKEAVERRRDYAEYVRPFHIELLKTSPPPEVGRNTNGLLWAIVPLNRDAEEIFAEQWEAKYRKKYGDDSKFPPVIYGETFSTKKSERTFTEFAEYAAWKLNQEEWRAHDRTPELDEHIKQQPEYERVLNKLLVEFYNVSPSELAAIRNQDPNTFSKWLNYESHNPSDSITESERKRAEGHYIQTVTLNGRSKLHILTPITEPVEKAVAALARIRRKSELKAADNARQQAKAERLGKKATKELVEAAIAQVTKAFSETFIMRYNPIDFNKLKGESPTDLHFSTISEEPQ
jgi:hypothetical protein